MYGIYSCQPPLFRAKGYDLKFIVLIASYFELTFLHTGSKRVRLCEAGECHPFKSWCSRNRLSTDQPLTRYAYLLTCLNFCVWLWSVQWVDVGWNDTVDYIGPLSRVYHIVCLLERAVLKETICYLFASLCSWLARLFVVSGENFKPSGSENYLLLSYHLCYWTVPWFHICEVWM